MLISKSHADDWGGGVYTPPPFRIRFQSSRGGDTESAPIRRNSTWVQPVWGGARPFGEGPGGLFETPPAVGRPPPLLFMRQFNWGGGLLKSNGGVRRYT